MILQDALGFIFSNINLILNFYFLNLQLWLKLNLIVESKPSEVIMVLNFFKKISFNPMVFCINCPVLILLNKMQLLRDNINTISMLQEP